MNVWQGWSLERRSICILSGPLFHSLATCSTIDPLTIKQTCRTGQGKCCTAPGPQTPPPAAQLAVQPVINGAGWPVQVSLSLSLPVALSACASSGKQADGPAPPSCSDSRPPLPAEGRPPVFAVSLRPYGPGYTCSAELTLSCYKCFALRGINTQP